LCALLQNYLSTNGLLGRELKLEIAALRSGMRQQSDTDAFLSLFVQLLEIMSSWEVDIESALESCNIDVQNSRECTYLGVLSLQCTHTSHIMNFRSVTLE